MKRLSLIFLCAALALFASACGPKEQGAADAGKTRDTKEDLYAQCELMAAAKETWHEAGVPETDGVFYAVTDLDENGRLELIRSITTGRGMFSELSFWEVNADRTALEELAYSPAEDESQPDFGHSDEVRCFKTLEGNFYIVLDSSYNGYGEADYAQTGIKLSEGRVDVTGIANCSIIAEDSDMDGTPELHAYYRSGEGEDAEINSQEYAYAADDHFGAGAVQYACRIGWTGITAQQAGSEVDLNTALRDSWEAFSFSREAERIEALRIYPEDFYDDPVYEPEETPDIVYDVSDMTDFWYLYEGGSASERWYAYDEGVECTLIIDTQGLAHFKYDNPADPRGAVALDAMNVEIMDGLGDPQEAANPSAGFGSEDGVDRFIAKINKEDGTLAVEWYRFDSAAPGADPEVMYLIFTNGVG